MISFWFCAIYRRVLQCSFEFLWYFWKLFRIFLTINCKLCLCLQACFKNRKMHKSVSSACFFFKSVFTYILLPLHELTIFLFFFVYPNCSEFQGHPTKRILNHPTTLFLGRSHTTSAEYVIQWRQDLLLRNEFPEYF